MKNQTFNEENFIQMLNDETVLADGDFPATTHYLDTAKYGRLVFIVPLGAVVDALTFAVYQDTSATKTANYKAVAGATKTIAGTDDNKFIIIEVDESMLDGDNDFRYVTLAVSGVAGNNYSAMMFIGRHADKLPVTQSTTLLEAVEVLVD